MCGLPAWTLSPRTPAYGEPVPAVRPLWLPWPAQGYVSAFQASKSARGFRGILLSINFDINFRLSGVGHAAGRRFAAPESSPRVPVVVERVQLPCPCPRRLLGPPRVLAAAGWPAPYLELREPLAGPARRERHTRGRGLLDVCSTSVGRRRLRDAIPASFRQPSFEDRFRQPSFGCSSVFGAIFLGAMSKVFLPCGGEFEVRGHVDAVCGAAGAF